MSRSLAVVAVLAVVAGALLLTRGGDQRTLSAEFASAPGLRNGDPVRVHGVKIGEVDGIALRPSRGRVVVRMRIGDDVALGRDARAALRWRTLLGGALYVDLDPGTPAAGRAADATRIPLARTRTQVELDQLLAPFDGGTVAATRTLLRGLRRGLSDPSATGATVAALAPALRTLERGLAPLRGEQPDDLRRLVATSARTVAALGADRHHLRGLIAGAAKTLRVTAARRAELGALLRRTPPALDATRTTARRIDTTLARLDPLAAALRPGVRRIGPTLAVAHTTLDRTTRLLRDARPLLVRLRPALHATQLASRSGRPLIDTLDPTVRRLDDELLPWLQRRDPDAGRSTAQLIGPALGAVAAATGEYDGEGNWLRFAPTGGERLLLPAPCQTFLTDPTAEQKLRCDELTSTLKGLLGGPRR